MQSPSAFQVRLAAGGDLDAITRMGVALTRLHHQWDADRFILPRGIDRVFHDYFASQLGVQETVMLVAELEGRVVGYAFASLVPRDWSDLRDACGKVHDLYVEEAARSAGVGGALLEEAVRRLEELGAPRVVLMVAARNRHARDLFGSMGFRETMIEMTRELDD